MKLMPKEYSKNTGRVIKIIKREEIIKPEDEDKVIYLGEKEDGIYLETILNKICDKQYNYLFFQTFPLPRKLAQIEQFFQRFRWLGVRRIEKIEDVAVPSKNKPGENNVVRIIRWDIIPSLRRYRDETVKTEIEEEKQRRVI